MIKQLLFITCIASALTGTSQILNPGFESVTAGKPDNYNLGPVYSTYPIRDTSAAHTGLHAAAIYGSIPPANPGAVVSEHALGPNLPVAATGWYKFFPQLGDSIAFECGVYKQGNIATAAPNVATYITAASAVFTQFTVPINYTGYGFTTCDSAFIILYPTGNVSSGGYNWAHPGTIAIIDDLAWTYTTVGVPEINTDLLVNVENVMPNPAKDHANIIYTVAEPSDVSLNIYDLTGKQIIRVIDKERQQKGRYKAEVQLNDLPAGVYLYEFTTSTGYKVTKKLIKQ
ncbi:MAG: T9SS type A sorting domain-containing protein [Bacteroidia bacterium]